MKKAVNYFRGSVRAEVTCLYPERFINLCAQNGIEFWDHKKVKPGVLWVIVHAADFARLREVAKKADIHVRAAKKEGMPFFFWRIRKRYLLLAGMLLCFAAVRVMALFIWEIEVSGNEKVPAEAILEAVRERIPKPEIIDESKPMEVYAEKTGIIVRMNVLAGEGRFKVGDTVEAGDILVSGTLDSISSGRRLVHAMAEVYARTWYEKTYRMPLETFGKEYTGNARRRLSVVIADKKIKLFIYSGIRFIKYDKIIKEDTLRLPTGNVLPITFITEEFAEYGPVKKAVNQQTAEELLRGELLSDLKDEVDGGTIASVSYESEVKNGVLYVTLYAECIEEIAGQRELTNDEVR